jgi:hypothetical protein
MERESNKPGNIHHPCHIPPWASPNYCGTPTAGQQPQIRNYIMAILGSSRGVVFSVQSERCQHNTMIEELKNDIF